jgi:hypothetical protein
MTTTGAALKGADWWVMNADGSNPRRLSSFDIPDRSGSSYVGGALSGQAFRSPLRARRCEARERSSPTTNRHMASSIIAASYQSRLGSSVCAPRPGGAGEHARMEKVASTGGPRLERVPMPGGRRPALVNVFFRRSTGLLLLYSVPTRFQTPNDDGGHPYPTGCH